MDRCRLVAPFIAAPEAAIRQAAEVNRIRTELNDELGREPSDVELADQTGISAKRIVNLRKLVIPAVAEGAFEPQGDKDNSLPGTVLSNKLSVAEEMVYESLSDRDKAIFTQTQHFYLLVQQWMRQLLELLLL